MPPHPESLQLFGSRDFCFAFSELQLISEKCSHAWMNGYAPEGPYFIAEHRDNLLYFFFDFDEVQEMTRRTVSCVTETPTMVAKIEQGALAAAAPLKEILSNPTAVSPKDLPTFIRQVSEYWGWMAAAWVLIDHYDALPEKPDFFHRLLEIRTNTDYYLPAVDAVLRLTIAQNLSLSAEEAKVVSLHELSRREAPSQKEITERIRYALVDHTGIHTGEGAVRLKQTFNIKHPEASNKRELKGRVACKGNYTGTAKVVLRTDDTQKMDKGDVLIASTTTPDWMYAIKLAGAIVTDEGGIISHAAIVSRELGIPCIIGTKSATTNIKDGDIVTIDTETGTITW